jgi:hypothetical protein
VRSQIAQDRSTVTRVTRVIVVEGTGLQRFCLRDRGTVGR